MVLKSSDRLREVLSFDVVNLLLFLVVTGMYENRL